MDARDTTAREYAGRLARAVKETVSAQLALARHSADLARATAAGDMSVVAAGREYLEAVAAEGVRFGTQTGDLARLQLEGVAAVGASLAGSVFHGPTRNGGAEPAVRATRGVGPVDPVEAEHAAPEPSPSDRSAPASGAVALHGPIGGTAEGAVVVANRHPRKRVVHLAADQLSDGVGGRSAAVLEIEPRKFTVPAGQEHAFRLLVRLTEGEVSSGSTYVSVLRISGGEEATVNVTVRID